MKLKISRRSFLQAAGIGALSLSLAACGGGGGNSSSSNSTSSSSNSSAGNEEQPDDGSSSGSSSGSDTPEDTTGWEINLLGNGAVSIEGYNGTVANGELVIPSEVVILGKTYTVTKIGVEEDSIFETNTDVNTVIVPSTVTEIGSRAFYDCENITSVSLPEGLEKIDYQAFESTGLTSLTIPASVEEVGYGLVRFCSSLETFVAKGSTTVFKTYEMFQSCTSLTKATFNSDLDEISNYMFDGCGNLKTFAIPETATYIGQGAFYACEALESITIPNGVTIIGTEAFAGCASLTSIKIPDSVKDIEMGAFWGCTALVYVELPAAMEVFDNEVFSRCYSLKKIVLPEGIEAIGVETFLYCKALETIYIPASVTIIENDFSTCTSLKTINYGGSEAAWNNMVPVPESIGLANVTVNCNASRPVV